MFINNEYEEKELENHGREDATNYLNTFLNKLAQSEGRRTQIKTAGDAMRIKALMDQPNNTTFKSMLGIDGKPFWVYQKVSYAPSNLGKNRGYIFYFICLNCERKSKYLYYYNPIRTPLCRKCCGYKYLQPTRPQRRISRFIRRHPEAANEFIKAYGPC